MLGSDGRLVACALSAIILFSSAATAGSYGNAGSRLRILVPQDNAALPPGDAIVIAEWSGEGSSLIQVLVNGKITNFTAARKGGLWTSVRLQEGRNLIRLAAPNDQATVSVFVSGGASYRYHPKIEQCEACHGEGAKTYKPAAAIDALCSRCHEGRSKGKFVHGPVAAGRCTSCHDPHGAPAARLLKLEKGCFTCHEPFPKAKQVHRPASRGKCVSCHNPHSAGNRYLLVSEGNALCLGCHNMFHSFHRSVVREGVMTKVPEDFPRDRDVMACIGCHAPHQSNETRLLRVPKEQSCRNCHDT